jgi:hypothetical protein
MCSLGEAANAATAKLLKNIEMKWSRIDLSKSTHQLLTADRPIDMPLGLADPEAYISLPVSPRILFVLPRPESTYNDCIREIWMLRMRSIMWANSLLLTIQAPGASIHAP